MNTFLNPLVQQLRTAETGIKLTNEFRKPFTCRVAVLLFTADLAAKVCQLLLCWFLLQA